MAMRVTGGFGSVVDDSGNLHAALADKNYMAALSIQFERMAVKLAMRDNTAADLLSVKELETLKPDLIRWVITNFPDGVLYEGDSL